MNLHRAAPLALLCACGAPSPAPMPDLAANADLAPPCTLQSQYPPTGFFRVESDCGRPRLVDPAGRPFYSFGINHISWDGTYSPASKTNPYAEAVRARYGTEEKWAAATAQRMTEWGWNTVGSWSSHGSLGKHLPHTVMLSLAGADWQNGTVPDYFDPAWDAAVEKKVASGTGNGALAADRNLVGYFIDNELHWGPDWRVGRDIFEEYMRMAPAAPGKQALVALLRVRHPTIADFNTAWKASFADWDAVGAATGLGPRGTSDAADADRSAFIGAVAERFFRVTTDAIRAADPNHLVLGVRFVAQLTPVEVVAAAARFLDVVSANSYEVVVDPQTIFRPDTYHFVDLGEGGFLEPFFRLTRKPILVTEFGFRAKDAGLPNTWPPTYPTLATQRERADRFQRYAERCLAAPWIVGYHWYEWQDDPPAGRFDGENNNWGLVDNADDPYPELTARTKQVNRAP